MAARPIPTLLAASLVLTAPVPLLAGAGCGPTVQPRGIGTRHAPREEGGIELELRTTDGRIVELADQRGAPVLLHLFATYDGQSLANHRELSRFARDHLDTVVLGVAIQLDAATFAAAFAESQSPPYTIVYEDGESIVHGTSPLGRLEAIPTLVMIDAHGRECARQVGYASARILESMHEIALSRGGIVATEETPEAGSEPEAESAPEAESEPEPAGPAPGGAARGEPPSGGPPSPGDPAPEDPVVGDGEVVIEP